MPGDRQHRNRKQRLNHLDAEVEQQPAGKRTQYDYGDDDKKHALEFCKVAARF